MSKRKRASIGKATEGSGGGSNVDESADDAAAKDDMVHVSPDLLAGSPDIFAGKKTESAVPEEPRTSAADEEPAASPGPHETTESVEAPVTTTPPPPYVSTTPYTSRQRTAGSSVLGIVFVVIGIFALVVVLTGSDLTQYGWPLFIIIPGLTLLVIGFVSVGAGATIPGGILSVLGVVLAYCNSTNDWPFLAYGWALVAPGGVGLGIYLQALRDHDQTELRTGRTLLFVGLMIFLIGFVLFESILGISGRDYFGPVGKAALPVLLIVVGIVLLVRSIQRSRSG
jgi:hypothetical protein